jgi:small subunit ribosomal protein S15
MSISKEKKQGLIEKYSLKNGDTGSVEVQVAILTERITNLTEHFTKNQKDFASRRGLLMLVARRRRLLDYLKTKSEKRYLDLIKRLKLKK